VSDGRFRSLPDLARMPAGAGHALVHALHSGAAHVIDARRLALLGELGSFATIAEHARRLAKGGDASALEAMIGELAKAGLLVSEHATLQRLRSGTGPDAPATIAVLAMTTRGRPAELERALDSHLGAAAARGDGLEVLVCDDGRRDDERAATAAVVRAVARRHPARVLYGDAADRRRYAGALAKEAGVEPALVVPALVAEDARIVGTGASRNAILLHAAGTALGCVDDDTHLPLLEVPEPIAGFSCAADPVLEHWFPEPGGRAVELGRTHAADPLSLHESLLGRSIGALARGAPASVAAASAGFLRDVTEHDGAVAVTQLGLAGDAATGSVLHYLLLEGAGRGRLLASEERYRDALASRQVLRGVRQPTITDHPFFMAYCTGLDCRRLLPPFMPYGRNADGVFGAMLRCCCRGGYLAHLPWAVRHDPPERRTSFEAMLDGLHEMAGSDLVCRLILACPVRAEHPDPAAAMRALGAALAYWGSLPLEAFEQVTRAAVLRTRSRDLAMIHDALARHASNPPWWARDLGRMAMELAQAAVDPRVAQPSDWIGWLGDAEGRDGFRGAVRSYGELVAVWPELWEAAKALRARGVGVAREV
jgi:hypothetical protein